MSSFNEYDALQRVTEIGQAFANDLNDGAEEHEPDYDGVYTYLDDDGALFLVYHAEWVGEGPRRQSTGTEFRWKMERVWDED